MGISQKTIFEVRRKADIVEVVGGVVQLKKAGSGFKALCPFHTEKTPSFNVSPQRQIFKCFGCGKAGDSITFIKEIESVNYFEAVEILAKRLGVRIEYTSQKEESAGRVRENILRANEMVARLYEQNLQSTAGRAAMEYLRSRGVKPESIKRFRLGLALNEWDQVINMGKKNGFALDLLIQAGLCKKGESGSCYDMFRNRLIFPIFDANGRVIAFAGRALEDNQQPKYFNSPESPVFVKGRTLYGLNFWKETIKEKKRVILVEGYFDVIIPTQEEMGPVLAPMGTNITEDQARTLTRHGVSRLSITFDPDEAGIKAAIRSIPILNACGIELDVIAMPGKMDPSDLAQKDPQAARETFSRGTELFRFVANYVVEQVKKEGIEVSTVQGATVIAERMIAICSEVASNQVQMSKIVSQLEKLGLPPSRLNEMLVSSRTRNSSTFQFRNPQSDIRNQTWWFMWTSTLINLLISDNSKIADIRDIVTPKDIDSESERKAYLAVLAVFDSSGAVSFADLLADDPDSGIEDSGRELFEFSEKLKINSEDINDTLDYVIEDLKKYKRKLEVETSYHTVKKNLADDQALENHVRLIRGKE